MRTTSRMLIAVFLSLLLPLQAGSALARSAGMSARHSMPASTAVGNTDGAPLQLAHAIGVPHQHDAHAHHEHRQVKKVAPSGKGDASHKSRHAKGNCSDCGKCCVTAAAALPSSLADSFELPVTRAAHLSTAARIAAHVPDGPERPPRLLTA